MSELKTMDGKQVLLLDLSEPAAIASARAYTVATRRSSSRSAQSDELCEQLEQLTNARVGKEQK